MENSRESRILLRALFFADFKRIDEAADGESGAQLLASHTYSAIVMELRPEGNGLLDFIHTHYPAALPRTVAIGTSSEPVLLGAARDAGVAAVVLKPFHTSDLLSVVTSIAAGNRGSVLAREGRDVQ